MAIKTAAPAFRVGTSGWSSAHWRGRFYPASLPTREWFRHYCGIFDTVEINNTFYRLPEPKTFDQWSAQAPPAFVYAVKANRFLTHQKKLHGVAAPLRRFLRRVDRLGIHLGPVLYQLPPEWKRDLKRLEKFCLLLPAHRTHAIEFRDPDWLVADTRALLARFGVCLCIHDLVNRHPRWITGKAVYVRFHGAISRYAGGYPPSHLRRWASWLRDVASAGRGVYAYFNNDAEARAVRDALTLRELLS